MNFTLTLSYYIDYLYQLLYPVVLVHFFFSVRRRCNLLYKTVKANGWCGEH